MKKNAFTMIELIAVIAILSLVISISSSVYINVRKSILNKEYNNLVTYLESKAVEYANNTNYMQVSVEKLIEEGYVDPDDESDIYNPKNNESMNCYLINMSVSSDGYVAKLDKNLGKENNKCKTYEEISNYSICELKEDGTCNNIPNDYWFNKNIKLGVSSSGKLVKDATFNWISSSGLNGSDYYLLTNTLLTSKNTYRVNITKNNVTSDVSKEIRIDLEAPVVSDVNFESEWKALKKVEIIATDKMGSGISGYALVKDGSSCNNYKTDNIIEVKESGTYKYCVKDKAGNVTEGVVVIDKIDNVAPGVPVITSSDGLKEDKWHTNIFTLSWKSTEGKSKVTYYFGTSTNNLAFTGSSLNINSNYSKKTIYVKACNEAEVCSSIASYKVLFDNTPPSYVSGGSLGKGSLSVPTYTDNAGGSGDVKVYTCVSKDTVTSINDSCFSTRTTYSYSCGKTFKLYSYAVDAAGNTSAIYDHYASNGTKYYKSCTHYSGGSSSSSGGSSSTGSSSKPSSGGSSPSSSSSSSSSSSGSSSSSSKPSSGSTSSSSSSSSSSSNKLPTCYGTFCGSYDKHPSSSSSSGGC